jgi:hypothetical protein
MNPAAIANWAALVLVWGGTVARIGVHLLRRLLRHRCWQVNVAAEAAITTGIVVATLTCAAQAHWAGFLVGGALAAVWLRELRYQGRPARGRAPSTTTGTSRDDRDR